MTYIDRRVKAPIVFCEISILQAATPETIESVAESVH